MGLRTARRRGQATVEYVLVAGGVILPLTFRAGVYDPVAVGLAQRG